MKDTKCMNHIIVVLVLVKTGGQQKGPPPTTCSQLSLTFSRPLVTNFPKKLTVGSGLFGVMKGKSKFTSIIMHRNTYCKGQRTQLKIWFSSANHNNIMSIQTRKGPLWP